MDSHRYNSGLHIDDIISRTSCDRHDAPEGIPCFSLNRDRRTAGRGDGVCGERIKMAGYNGQINSQSLSLRQYANKKSRFS